MRTSPPLHSHGVSKMHSTGSSVRVRHERHCPVAAVTAQRERVLAERVAEANPCGWVRVLLAHAQQNATLACWDDDPGPLRTLGPGEQPRARGRYTASTM